MKKDQVEKKKIKDFSNKKKKQWARKNKKRMAGARPKTDEADNNIAS